MANRYPPVGFHFTVKFDFSESDFNGDISKAESGFQEVSGISATVELQDVMEGGENNVTYSLPKAVKQGKLSLKRGMFVDSVLLDWVKEAIEEFKFSTCSVQVTLLNPEHKPLAAWEFDRAYPVSWNLSGFSSTDNSYVVESMDLRYTEFRAVEI